MNEVSGFAAALSDRANSRCELCDSEHGLSVLEVPPTSVADMDRSVLICEKCSAQIATCEPGDLNHWRCLNDAAWSEVTAVKVLTWRLLKRMEAQAWAKDLLDQMYLEDDIRKWAESVGLDDAQTPDDEGGNAPTVDSGPEQRRFRLHRERSQRPRHLIYRQAWNHRPQYSAHE